MRQLSFKAYLCMAVGVALVTLGFAGAQPSYGEPRFLWGEGTPRFERIPGGNPDEALAQAAAGSNVPLWSGSFVFHGTPFDFMTVGTDPGLGFGDLEHPGRNRSHQVRIRWRNDTLRE